MAGAGVEDLVGVAEVGRVLTSVVGVGSRFIDVAVMTGVERGTEVFVGGTVGTVARKTLIAVP